VIVRALSGARLALICLVSACVPIVGTSFEGAAAVDGAPTIFTPVASEDPATLLNVQRSAAGLPSLARNASLDTVATAYAAEIAASGRLDHIGGDGRDPGQRIAALCRFSAAGENIARGQPSTSATFRIWMGSEVHRRNIQGQSYRIFGFGEVSGVRVLLFASGC